MKKRRQYTKRTHKKNPKIMAAILGIIAAILIGLVVWIAVNDWNVEKTLQQAGFAEEEPETLESAESPELSGLETEPGKELEDKDAETEEAPAAPEKTAPSEGQSESFDGGYLEGQSLPEEPTVVDGILVANKENPLPETFAPGESKEAREAFEEMAAEAKLSGFNLTAFSTYRSYDYQVTLYNRYADRDGKEAADRYSARPGYSEHQTGLAFDIGEVNHEKHWASQSFGETEAGKWLLANAHRHGFILRYPMNKEDITGYMNEAWHYRYVGKEVSDEIFKKNITLEEYLGLK